MIEQIEWIACAERLPELGDDVLCYATDRTPPVMVGRRLRHPITVDRRDYHWENDDGWYYNITHWAPLPAGPRA